MSAKHIAASVALVSAVAALATQILPAVFDKDETIEILRWTARISLAMSLVLTIVLHFMGKRKRHEKQGVGVFYVDPDGKAARDLDERQDGRNAQQ